MPLIIPVSRNSSEKNQGGGGGGLGPLSRIYAEYENSKKKPAAKKRSLSADREGSNGRDVAQKKKRSSLKDLPINNDLPILNKTNANVAAAAVDENNLKQCNSYNEKMSLKKEECNAPPCGYVDGCTNKSIKDGLCKTHWCAVNLCAFDGCIKMAWGKGLCREHNFSTYAHDTLRMRSNAVGTEEVDREVSMEDEVTDTGEVLQAKEDVTSIAVNKKLHVKQHKQNACSAKKYGQRKPCVAEGCSNQAVMNGVCFRHGAKRKLCNADGCTNHSIRGGVCFRHGAKRKLCKADGCTNLTQRKGVCVRHGALRNSGDYKAKETKEVNGRPVLCVEVPPDLLSKPSSAEAAYEPEEAHVAVLRSVSASSTETHSINAAASEMSDQCRAPSSNGGSSPPLTSQVTKECTKTKNGRKVRSCKTQGCTNRAIQGGQCFRHGAKAHRKLCSSEGCKNYVVKAGLCIKHGARQGPKKNAKEEPEHEKPVKSLKHEDDSSVSEEDMEKREQDDDLFQSIDRLEGSCADILLLLKNDG
eukprot:scaffold1793_cov142-Skeletonema_menzelii.AAC.1